MAGMERDQISDIRPRKKSNIRYQISDQTKNQLSDITPPKKSDIKVPPFHPLQ